MAITHKLLAFQMLGITLEKDGNNPHFRSEYVTLNEVLRKVKKPLNDLGVVIIQQGGTDKLGAHGLYTVLHDTEDGSETTCFMPYIGTPDSQKLGAANTYLRRYSLITMLGLEDEDDDGNTASAKPAAKGKGVGAQTDEPFKI